MSDDNNDFSDSEEYLDDSSEYTDLTESEVSDLKRQIGNNTSNIMYYYSSLLDFYGIIIKNGIKLLSKL